ncbi:hypothetical protein [Nocardia sp. CA-290969]|uniref:hypothetical protein n=1 Tax=Nocardia sp. CA-290969 TaxID=3239986 RepID=UPI003D9092F8
MFSRAGDDRGIGVYSVASPPSAFLVWPREHDLALVDRYLDAIEKVIHHADHLKG